MSDRAKQLAMDHWKYVRSTIEAHIPDDDFTYSRESLLDMCEHHYLTAAVHFHGHGVEDERNGLFRPKIGEPLTTGEIAAIARPCSTCHDETKCQGGLRLASGDCLHHRPRG